MNAIGRPQVDVIAAARLLLDGLTPAAAPLQPAAGESLPAGDDTFYYIDAGSVEWRLGGVAALTCGAGELAALEQWAATATNTLVARENCQLTPYDRNAMLEHASGDVARTRALFELLDSRGRKVSDLLSRRTTIESAAELQRRYAAGDVIITEGDSADFVYTLISGHAEARQGSVKVGDVHESEIFGAMAAFTGEARSASVIAATDCEVVGVPKENFVDLVRMRPDLCEQLIETMARQISALNDTIIELYGNPDDA